MPAMRPGVSAARFFLQRLLMLEITMLPGKEITVTTPHGEIIRIMSWYCDPSSWEALNARPEKLFDRSARFAIDNGRECPMMWA
jgi:hypothetical protein